MTELKQLIQEGKWLSEVEFSIIKLPYRMDYFLNVMHKGKFPVGENGETNVDGHTLVSAYMFSYCTAVQPYDYNLYPKDKDLSAEHEEQRRKALAVLDKDILPEDLSILVTPAHSFKYKILIRGYKKALEVFDLPKNVQEAAVQARIIDELNKDYQYNMDYPQSVYDAFSSFKK